MDFLGENGLARLWEHFLSKLDTKVNKINGMGLSRNDYTDEEKDKLSNVEFGAQVNAITSVNGRTGDVVLTISDLGGSSEETLDLAKEYTDEVASGKADIEHTHIASDIEDLQTSLDTRVPTYRTINGKELSEDILLSASDIGADVVGSAESALENANIYTNEIAETKSDVGHTHDDMYYTEGEIDSKVSEINLSITNIIDGTITVGEASHALNADNSLNANVAEKAIQDNTGNLIIDTYETKNDAVSKLIESKAYTDSSIAEYVPDSLTEIQIDEICGSIDEGDIGDGSYEIVTDGTLTQSGMAADAKVVGDRLATINSSMVKSVNGANPDDGGNIDVITDSTLVLSGIPADAKATGDAINNIKVTMLQDVLNELPTFFYNQTQPTNWKNGDIWLKPVD